MDVRMSAGKTWVTETARAETLGMGLNWLTSDHVYLWCHFHIIFGGFFACFYSPILFALSVNSENKTAIMLHKSPGYVQTFSASTLRQEQF